MQNILGVKPDVLAEALKRASIGRGKESSYNLIITKNLVDNKNQCTVVCGNGNVQATSAFYAQLVRMDTVDGKEQVHKEPIEENIYIYADAVFREVVEALAETQENILLVNEGKSLVAKNKRSSVPIPTLGSYVGIENPKDKKTIQIELDREELEEAMKYVSAGLTMSANSKYKSNYGLLPSVIDGKAVLHIAGCDEKIVACKDIELSSICDDYAEKCTNVTYAMIPADKLNQMISVTTQKIRIVFYYGEDQISSRQVNIQIGNDLFQILTSVTQRYPLNLKSIIQNGYMKYDGFFTAEAKALRNAFYITGIGAKDPGKVKSVILLRDGIVTIANEDGNQVTKLKEIEVQTGPGLEQVRIGVACNLMLSALKPFNGKIRIQGSNEDTAGLITFIGDSEVKIGMFPILTAEAKAKLKEKKKSGKAAKESEGSTPDDKEKEKEDTKE